MAGNLHPVLPPHVAAFPANDHEDDDPTDREQRVYIDRPLPRTLANSLQGDVHQQKQSPLFSLLPAEVRDKIFDYVFAAYENKNRPYHPQNWFYRPGFHYHDRISTESLATCKRIYLRYYLKPIAINTHVFWGSGNRGPPDSYYGTKSKTSPRAYQPRPPHETLCTNPRRLLYQLTEAQMRAVEKIHFFTQQSYLEHIHFSSSSGGTTIARLWCRSLKITLRHQDWHGSDLNFPLRICPWESSSQPNRIQIHPSSTPSSAAPPMPTSHASYTTGWGSQLAGIDGLQTFTFELETLELKRLELQAITEEAKAWIMPAEGMGWMVWDEGHGVRESSWDEDELPLHGDVVVGGGGVPQARDGMVGRREYCVVEMRWRRVGCWADVLELRKRVGGEQGG